MRANGGISQMDPDLEKQYIQAVSRGETARAIAVLRRVNLLETRLTPVSSCRYSDAIVVDKWNCPAHCCRIQQSRHCHLYSSATWYCAADQCRRQSQSLFGRAA